MIKQHKIWLNDEIKRKKNSTKVSNRKIRNLLKMRTKWKNQPYEKLQLKA
jgi:uncharacterized protein YdcH (DUF465 family)